MKFGVTKLSSDSLFGYKYYDPVEVSLQRTSIHYKLISTDFGRMYEGGARITVPPVKKCKGVVVLVPMFETVFKGDIIVVKDKPIRDYDVLTKGKRDFIFAFDVKKILSVVSVDALGNEIKHAYTTDYILSINSVNPDVSIDADGVVTINPTVNMPVVSDVQIVWQSGGTSPRDGRDYNVEFMCSPNYVVNDDLANVRAVQNNDLPRTVMTVKRSYFLQKDNPIDGIPTQQPVLDEYAPESDHKY